MRLFPPQNKFVFVFEEFETIDHLFQNLPSLLSLMTHNCCESFQLKQFTLWPKKGKWILNLEALASSKQICLFILLNLKPPFSFFFLRLFHVVTHNYWGSFQFTQFTIWTKKWNQFLNFDTLACSKQIRLISLIEFKITNYFLPRLHHFSISWYATSVDVFRSIAYILLAQKQQKKF